MRRRDMLKAALGFTWIAVPNATVAQTRGPKRIGYLSGSEASSGLRENTIDILEERLRDLGWRSGETIEFERRWADGDFSRLPRLASELVMLKPDVIVATGSSETSALHAATKDIPVVFIQVLDPVALGVVESIARPGGNITGLAQGPQILWGKRLGLLTELLGHVPRDVAWLGNPGNAGSEASWADAKDATAQAGANLVRIDVSRADELDTAFTRTKGSEALLVQWDFLFAVARKRIAELATQTRLPAVYENRAQVSAGGLMSYGGDLRENYRQGAIYVDRILKGARPADLPVIQASRVELVLNKGAAKAIGLTIPDSLIARADEVIE
jgi:putative tryptophan/tyrosine transport system substrate-binding protein